MRNYIFILSLLISLSSFSQTKLIAHKSHSGSTREFKTSLKVSLFDSSTSNFGEIPIHSLSKEDKENLSIKIKHKRITYQSHSANRQFSTTNSQIILELQKIPDGDFEIYLNQDLVVSKQNYLPNKKITLQLKKGVKNYLVLNAPKANDKSSAIFVDFTLNESKFSLWADYTESNVIFINQIAK